VGRLLIPAGILLLVVGVPARASAPAQPPSRVADADDQAKEASEATFRKDIAAAEATRSAADDIDVARRMVGFARQADQPPALAIWVLEEAARLAAKAIEGYPVAAEALELLASRVPDRAADARARAIDLWQKVYRAVRAEEQAEAGQRLVDLLAAQGAEESHAMDYGKASATYLRAFGIAEALELPEARTLRSRLAQAKTRMRIKNEVDRLTAHLAEKPDDVEARDRVVRLFLVELDAPEQAGKYLAVGANDLESKLILLAGMTLGRLPEAALLKLGQWYANLAAKAGPAAEEAMLLRAETYYEVFLEKHADDDALRAQAEAGLQAVAGALEKFKPKPKLPPGAVLVLTFSRNTFFVSNNTSYVRDLSGLGNHGTVHGGAIEGGPVGDALRFDGKADAVDFGSPSSLKITGSMTVSLWLMPSRLKVRQNPFAKAYGGEGTMTLEPDGRINFFYGRGGGNTSPYVSIAMTKPLSVGQWAHLVLVRDFEKKKITWYKNGAKTDQQSTAYGSSVASTLPLRLGRGYVENFGGLIDEVAVFARALSEDEIQYLFKLGKKGQSLNRR